jgi:hypothetical protein
MDATSQDDPRIQKLQNEVQKCVDLCADKHIGQIPTMKKNVMNALK